MKNNINNLINSTVKIMNGSLSMLNSNSGNIETLSKIEDAILEALTFSTIIPKEVVEQYKDTFTVDLDGLSVEEHINKYISIGYDKFCSKQYLVLYMTSLDFCSKILSTLREIDSIVDAIEGAKDLADTYAALKQHIRLMRCVMENGNESPTPDMMMH